ncbi:hypothetical protein D3C84_832960 [compost metagenome]
MAFATDGAEVHEDIVAHVAGNETEALGGVEPLHRAGFPIDAQVLRGGGWVILAQLAVDAQVQGYSQAKGGQAQQDCRLAADQWQWGQQNQGLQHHGQYQQGGDQGLQLVAHALLAQAQQWCDK